MPLPLIPVVAALAAGGSLVPHAAGGLIVTSASGYVAGTYLSTTAIGGLLYAAAATATGATGVLISSTAAAVVGGAGIFGTTIGASGITGVLMSAGLISSTPVWVPLAIGGAAVGCGYGGYRLLKLKKKIVMTPEGAEATFSETEAKIVEKIVKRLAKKDEGKGAA